MLQKAYHTVGSRIRFFQFNRTLCTPNSINTTRSYATDANNDSQERPSSDATGVEQKGGFLRAMAKLEGHESFAKMLRNSPFVQMGDPRGKMTEGIIVHVVDDDLYIDFGFKFNCVCPRPQKNGSAFTLGKKVRVLVHDLELSTRFLGAKTDLTILEADCTLIGLLGRQDRLSSGLSEDVTPNRII